MLPMVKAFATPPMSTDGADRESVAEVAPSLKDEQHTDLSALSRVEQLESDLEEARREGNARAIQFQKIAVQLLNERSALVKFAEALDRRSAQMRRSRLWKITNFVRKVASRLTLVRRKRRSSPSIAWPKLTPEPEIRRLLELRQGAKRPVFAEPRRAEISPSDPFFAMRQALPDNRAALEAEYVAKGLDREEDTFVLYRIIGNDLPPRHQRGQSRNNVRFILENEPTLAGCEKRWVINRIVDAREREVVIDLLERHKQNYVLIPFKAQEYARIGLDLSVFPSLDFFASEEFDSLDQASKARAVAAAYRLKNNYVMNNNGARNAALRDGRKHAKWILPWDGNSYLTSDAWDALKQDILSAPYLKYFATPMDRVPSNEVLLDHRYEPRPVEEPQLVFRRDAREMFNEAFPYGRRPKLEMLWHLGIPGPWDELQDAVFDLQPRTLSPEGRCFGVAGWTARLFSGVPELETTDTMGARRRTRARQTAIVDMLSEVDGRVLGGPRDLAVYSPHRIEALSEAVRSGTVTPPDEAAAILSAADQALTRGPYAVTDKPAPPPGGTRNDYWTLAPYWHPDPSKPDGLPYIRKDGEWAPGTELNSAGSEQFDRTRLQSMLDDVTTLALAWQLTGEDRYAAHAAGLIRVWFIDPATRMTPHLRFAQVRRGHGKEGAAPGIMELKDFAVFLDGVRLVQQSGRMSDAEQHEFSQWLASFRRWLHESPQGRGARLASNNRGTYYDLTLAAIDAFFGNAAELRSSVLRSLSRLYGQVSGDGTMSEELGRTRSAHYVVLNLQGWLALLRLYEAAGISLGTVDAAPLSRLKSAFEWLAAQDLDHWTYEQISAFNRDRLVPLFAGARDLGLASASPSQADRKNLGFHPDDAVPLYWDLTLSPVVKPASPHVATTAIDCPPDGIMLDPVSRVSGDIIHVVALRHAIGVFEQRWIDYRMALLRAITSGSLRQQTTQDFHLLLQVDVQIDNDHLRQLRELLDGVGHLYVQQLQLHRDRHRGLRSFCKQLAGPRARHFLTTRLDDDDAISPGVIAGLQARARDIVAEGHARGGIGVEAGYRFLASERLGIWGKETGSSVAMSVVLPANEDRSVYSWGHHQIKDEFPDAMKFVTEDVGTRLYTIHKFADVSFASRFPKSSASVVPLGDDTLGRHGVDISALADWQALDSSEVELGGPTRTIEEVSALDGAIVRARRNRSPEGRAALEELLDERRRFGMNVVSLRAVNPQP
jgi:hypothetical protein